MQSKRLQQLVTKGHKGNPLDRLDALELAQRQAMLHNVVVGTVSEITNDLGTITQGQFIAPASDATSTEPTDSGFTGSVVSGDPVTFAEGDFNIFAVAAGLLQAGFNTAGKLIAGQGAVILDEDGLSISTPASAGVKNKITFGAGGEVYGQTPLAPEKAEMNFVTGITKAAGVINITAQGTDTAIVGIGATGDSNAYLNFVASDTGGQVDISLDTDAGIAFNTVGLPFTFNGPLTIAESAAPSTPASGYLTVFADTGSRPAAITDTALVGQIPIAPKATINAENTSGTGETILATYTIPAAVLAQAWDGVRITGFVDTTSGASTKTWRLRFGGIGGTILISDTSTGAVRAKVLAHVWRTGAATQEAFGESVDSAGNTGETTTSPTQTLANAVDIVLTGQTTNASHTVKNPMLMVEFLPMVNA